MEVTMMKKLSYDKVKKGIENRDILPASGYTPEGFDLYCTNDEGSGYGLIIVHEGEKLAVDSGFFDDGDFYEGSDYNPTLYNDGITCRFYVE